MDVGHAPHTLLEYGFRWLYWKNADAQNASASYDFLHTIEVYFVKPLRRSMPTVV